MKSACFVAAAAAVVCLLGKARVVSAFGVCPRVAATPKKFSTRLDATWSDNRATQDYRNFLESGKSALDRREDGPSVIIKSKDGDSQLADALVKMGLGGDVVLSAGEELPSSIGDDITEYPIFVTVPATELAEFLDSLPEGFEERRDDMVFISGGQVYGNIEKVLQDKFYCKDDMTQFIATGIQLSPRIGDLSVKLGTSAGGDEKWAGECVVCGKWGDAIEERLERNDIRSKKVYYREWRRLMWERSLYDAVFNLVGSVRDEPTTMADVANYYESEASGMAWEISSLLRASKAITLTYGFEERIFGVGESTGTEQPCVLDPAMYPYIYQPFELASTLMEYLCYAQDEKDLLEGIKLPRKADTSKVPVIRKGNLRADGVI